jgi:hypothetical protein
MLCYKQKRPITESFHNFGGEGEIRTLGELPHDGFQDRYLKPLGHLSTVGTSNILTDTRQSVEGLIGQGSNVNGLYANIRQHIGSRLDG